MDLLYTLIFTVFPYLCLTTFVVGHGYRYVTDRYGWNARSSEFLEKKALFPGSVLFHWGIVFTFLGHAGGLLVPQRVFDFFGIDSQTPIWPSPTGAAWQSDWPPLSAYCSCCGDA
jgi:nitrate reductase gamma subunit